jgi:hypothetical protein
MNTYTGCTTEIPAGLARCLPCAQALASRCPPR